MKAIAPPHNQSSKRIIFLDYLRAFACVAVVGIHVIVSQTNNTPVSEWTSRMRIDSVIVETICRLAVPIFITITGSLLLRKERELSWAKIKTCIIRMFLVLVTFGLGYCFIESFSDGARGLSLIIEPILNLIQGKSWAVMWYVYMLIGLYAITPIVKAYTDKAEQKDYCKTLAILFIVSSLIPTINNLTGLRLSQFYLQGLLYVFYYMLGQYLFRYDISRKLLVALVILGLAGTTVLNVFDGTVFELEKLSSVFMVALVIGVYSLIKTAKLKESKIVNFIAKYSFGIYLIHTFWLNILNKGLGIYPSSMPIIVGEVAIFAYALITSILSCLILYRLPVFKKILR